MDLLNCKYSHVSMTMAWWGKVFVQFVVFGSGQWFNCLDMLSSTVHHWLDWLANILQLANLAFNYVDCWIILAGNVLQNGEGFTSCFTGEPYPIFNLTLLLYFVNYSSNLWGCFILALCHGILRKRLIFPFNFWLCSSSQKSVIYAQSYKHRFACHSVGTTYVCQLWIAVTVFPTLCSIRLPRTE